MKIRRSLAAGLGVALLAPLGLPGLASAETPETVAIVKGDTWLRTQQQADGGFEVAGFPGFETPDAAFALAAVGDGAWDSAGSRTYVQAALTGGKGPLDAIDDLVDGDADPTTIAAGARAAKVVALVAAPLGLDVTDFDPSNDSPAAVDLIARMDLHKQVDGSYDFGAQFNGVLYTALALHGAGLSIPNGLVDQIRAAQRADGSWDYTGTTSGDGDDIDTTALALLALHSAGVAATDVDADAGIAYLADHQQPSGAWAAFGSDDPNSTAMAVQALSALHIDVTTSAWRAAAGAPVSGAYTSPYAWLIAQQQADGHIASPNDAFSVTTFATSQAMQALGRQWFLSADYGYLIDQWSRELASPAASPASAQVTTTGANPLTNPSVRSARLAAATAVLASTNGRNAAAADLFRAAFNRAIDPSGKAYWANQLKTLSRPEVLARLTGSSEYYRKAGGTIPTFVDAVYQSVLGRAPDAAGRAYWIGKLQKGTSVQAVARSLTASSEYRRKQVNASFLRLLDRAPATGERDYWTTKIATTRIEVLLATLGASAEYYGVPAA